MYDRLLPNPSMYTCIGTLTACLSHVLLPDQCIQKDAGEHLLESVILHFQTFPHFTSPSLLVGSL